ncbi:MAG: hypothetical protein PHC60_07930 [Heliobacteriaceae bacterium]|nr:hypothetical protein [Heliobacteriaceae bacterium]MDD4588300.1 hypothetical protein [Heliobacteriaceae bacterium]
MAFNFRTLFTAAILGLLISLLPTGPAMAVIPGIAEISLPDQLNTNVAAITGRLENSESTLCLNSRPVPADPTGQFAADVVLHFNAAGIASLLITVETDGTVQSYTHSVRALKRPVPFLTFTVTEHTTEGMALVQGQVNPAKTASLIAVRLPLNAPPNEIEKKVPGSLFRSTKAETLVRTLFTSKITGIQGFIPIEIKVPAGIPDGTKVTLTYAGSTAKASNPNTVTKGLIQATVDVSEGWENTLAITPAGRSPAYIQGISPGMASGSGDNAFVITSVTAAMLNGNEQVLAVAVPFDPQGLFQCRLPLLAGKNKVILAAVDLNGRVYTQMRETGSDFSITVNSPFDRDGAVVETDRSILILSGETRPEKAYGPIRNSIAVWVNSTPIEVNSYGRFEAVILLHAGENQISLQARDSLDRSFTQNYVVRYTGAAGSLPASGDPVVISPDRTNR